VKAEWWERRMSGDLDICKEFDPNPMIAEMSDTLDRGMQKYVGSP
jgi:hypothetical protein